MENGKRKTQNGQRLRRLVALCALPLALHAQPRFKVVAHQTAIGHNYAGTLRCLVGLPHFPQTTRFNAKAQSQLDSLLRVTQQTQTVQLPNSLGAAVRWSLYEITGKLIRSATAQLPETGGRDVDVGVASGLCFLHCSSEDNSVTVVIPILFSD